ncbi:kinase-like domain-containing protein [Irpex rosettiformis]|uniref:Kinase-like domain-containing protein n=1 Tax=Irpex rosettiformis TaxID=378272 RepID=A0ACB8UI51_9APHY|nr:kinase-like domain-containing protein [Irpex rosettiformis]
MCLAKALYSVLSTLSALCSFITNTALKFPSIAATLGTRLSDVVSSAIQLYLPLSLFSRIVAAINPYIPEPPIQLCVLGSGIHCDAVRHRPTISDLADQLVCHLVGLVQSSCGALFDSFYRTLSVPYGVVTDWLFSLFDSAFFFLDSLWVLKIFNTPLDGEELYATDKGSASLAIVQVLHGNLWYPTDRQGELFWPNGNRSLNAYLLQNGPMSASDAMHVFRQLVEVVAACHRRDAAHRDIKPDNIFIDSNLKVKPTDSGNSLEPSSTHLPNHSKFQVEKGDARALGVVLYEMVASRRPFRTIEVIKEGSIVFGLSHIGNLAGLVSLWLVIRDCLQTDPEKQ